MEIRRAEIRDIPGMTALLYQVGEVHHVIRPDIFRSGALKYTEEELREILKDDQRPIFVASEGGFVAGYCFCIHRDYMGSTVQADRKELYIDDLCVDENRRGQGIAKALYAHVCGYARGCGCAFVTLNVWSGNDRAMGFYEKAGMKPRSITMDMPLEETGC